jgi:hypothetical protein
MKKVLSVIFLMTATLVNAQEKQDTVTIELAKTSRVVFTVRDKNDLEILKHYDFNELFREIIRKLEVRDTTASLHHDSTEAVATVVVPNESGNDEDWSVNKDDDGDDDSYYRKRGHTEQSFNLDLGTNNFLEKGKFPNSNNAPYSVRPWGSWYVGMSSVQRTRLGNNTFLEWGLGMSWYTFKFEKDNILIQKDDNGIQFIEDESTTRDYRKSKLSASYITASIVPVIDFSGSSDKSRLWDNDSHAFRFGIGPYIAYRVGSHSKVVYEEDGDKEKDKDNDSFYLNNFRYGARLQIGFRSTDLFFNYDLNELFTPGKAPKLNAFSFGIIF